MVDIDSYRVTANFYDDAYSVGKELGDIPFYVDLAKESGGPVLEMACGTGRVLLPIARAGVEITGLEMAKPMIEVLRNHLEQEEDSVRNRVNVVEGDMRSSEVGDTFPLVIIPFRPLQHMYTVEDQVAALRNAGEHLRPGGQLALDVFIPRYDILFAGIGEEVLELEWHPTSAPHQLVKRSFRKDWVDKVNQVFRGVMIYRVYEGDAMVEEETEGLQMAYFTYPHLQAVAKLAGLKIVHPFGGFQKQPLDNDASEMVLILERDSGQGQDQDC